MAKTKSKVRWDRIEELRDFLKEMRQTKYKKFEMGEWIGPVDLCDEGKWDELQSPTIGDLRENGKHCSTAACLAGWCVILNAPKTKHKHEIYVREWAERYLGLSWTEANHMFLCGWGENDEGNWTKCSKRHAVKYLTKAIEEKNIFVTI